MLGHLVGAWDPHDVVGAERWLRRGVLATINLVGIVVLAISFWNGISPPWNQPVAIVSVLFFLILARGANVV
jgi:hypothetical protein